MEKKFETFILNESERRGRERLCVHIESPQKKFLGEFEI
jgi:hypothetical protein